MRFALIVVLIGLAAGHAFAETPDSRPDLTVRAVLPGCRSLVASQGIPSTVEAGFCSGMIDLVAIPMSCPILRRRTAARCR